jgi:hypothetical protein
MADSEVRAAIVTELVSFPDFQWKSCGKFDKGLAELVPLSCCATENDWYGLLELAGGQLIRRHDHQISTLITSFPSWSTQF